MGDLKRGIKKPFKWIGGQFKDALEGSKQIAERLGYERAGITPKSDSTKAMLAAANAGDPAIPIADDEELRRARRRRYAGAARTGRAATVLSEEDDLLG